MQNFREKENELDARDFFAGRKEREVDRAGEDGIDG